MFVNDNHFTEWMEHLSGKLNKIGQDLKSLIRTDTIFDKDEKPLDNRDLCQLLHVSYRTFGTVIFEIANNGKENYYYICRLSRNILMCK
jgi:hypothetical protein